MVHDVCKVCTFLSFHWPDYVDNSIDLDQNKVRYMDEKKKQKKLKLIYKDLKTDYDKLEAMASSSSVKDKTFQDPRVYELWALAQKAKIPREELESFKVQLCMLF